MYIEGKENLKNEIENMKLNNAKNSLIEVINMGIDENIIFNALRSIYEIAFKAPKFKNDNDVMCASFQYVDMEYAVSPIQALIEELVNAGLGRDNAMEKCFEVVEEYYEKSASSQEYSSMSGMVRNDNTQLYGHVGTYYNFNRIPDDSWEFIKNYIIERLTI